METIVTGPRRGTVHSVHDAVVDIRFAPEALPIPTSLLMSTGDERAHLRVVAQLDRETVRALRSPASPPITIGSRVTTLDDPEPDEPLDLAILHRVLDQLAPRTAEPHGLIETGIKVIDVFCPLQAGMRVALCGTALSVGTFVAMRELTQRLQGHAQSLSLFATTPTFAADAWRAMRQKWAHAVIVGSEVTAFQILTSGDDPAPFTQATAWDAVLGFSTALAQADLRPAIDPLQSTSRALTADVVGDDHMAIVMNARLHLSELAQDGARSARLHRARLLRSYLTQPFYVTEAFSGRAGVHVDRRDALVDCAAILAGHHDQLDLQALYLGGRPPRP